LQFAAQYKEGLRLDTMDKQTARLAAESFGGVSFRHDLRGQSLLPGAVGVGKRF
jgi:hypothetical protein